MEIECILKSKSRKMLTDKLYKYQRNGGKDHIKLDIDKELFQQILFENKKIAIPDNLWKLLDLSGVSFDGIDVKRIDFAESKGVKLNPQTVYDKSLYYTKLAGVEIDGSFDGVKLEGTDFTGSKGALMCFEEAEAAIKLDANLADVKIIYTDEYKKIEDKIEKAFQPQLKL